MAMTKTKTYSDCFLYNQYSNYQVVLVDTITNADRIDKTEKIFEDVVYEIKRSRTDASIMKVLTSDNSVLVYPNSVMPKAMKVFVAKDILKDKKHKAFIDVSNIITKSPDGYKVNDTALLSHLVNAKFSMYYTLNNRLVDKPTLNLLACRNFASLYTHIVDYLGKISIIDYAKERCLYYTSRYFAESVLMIDTDAARSIAVKISGITDVKEGLYDNSIENYENDNKIYPLDNVKEFSKFIGWIFKLEDFRFDTLLEKWMYLYGPGTLFALEYYPALAATITDAYCGAYLNNQKTIEKICGKDMIEFAKQVIYHI